MTDSGATTSTQSEVTTQVAGVLCDLLAQRYPYIGEHSDAVAKLADRIAPTFRLSPDEHKALLQAALLHDIGKLAIPERILRKAEALDEEETELMRRHTIVGAQILSSAGVTPLTVSLVRSSHERIDGTGYPDGLAGPDIPIGARIIAVCDAYDAMTSPRPYRPVPMDAQTAREELMRCSGSQFDAAVVAATEDVNLARAGR
jgi:two-component system, cell cycle response regulator